MIVVEWKLTTFLHHEPCLDAPPRTRGVGRLHAVHGAEQWATPLVHGGESNHGSWCKSLVNSYSKHWVFAVTLNCTCTADASKIWTSITCWWWWTGPLLTDVIVTWSKCTLTLKQLDDFFQNLFKSPQSGMTLCFQFASAASPASAAATNFDSHVKTVSAKP